MSDSAEQTTNTPAPKKLSRKQQRKKQQRKQLATALAILAVVVVIIAAVIFYNRWKDDQIETLPQDQRITAVVNGQETEIPPYSACQIGDKDCKPGEPFVLHVGDAKEFTLKIPQDVYDHDWSLLQIFDDPGANAESYFKANEKQEITIQTTSDKKAADGATPKLAVVEVHTMLIGLDGNGEQTPVGTVWALQVEK